jgi:hypothetical protein
MGDLAMSKQSNERKQELPLKEIERRRDAALLRALSTPHKRQAEMKIGKPSKRGAHQDSVNSERSPQSRI